METSDEEKIDYNINRIVTFVGLARRSRLEVASGYKTEASKGAFKLHCKNQQIRLKKFTKP